MIRARTFSSFTLLVRPARGRQAGELVRVSMEEAAAGLLEGVGVVPDAGGFADDSTAMTRHLVARVAGHPGATLALSADRESGFVFLRLRARPELIARAEPALLELAALIAAAVPGARIGLRRRGPRATAPQAGGSSAARGS
ncbi:hypothetical protein VD659_10880 [Herbiconiux sp. 11R-BC]|uniref:hypothetical protein n=1 Tax=Herbiconiux sp. 11R-BC TaxID=3111637 RepID=UPI003C06E4A7